MESLQLVPVHIGFPLLILVLCLGSIIHDFSCKRLELYDSDLDGSERFFVCFLPPFLITIFVLCWFGVEKIWNL